MCIIAIKPENAPIDWGILNNCERSNPDGGGYAYAIGNKVIIRKGFFTNDDIKRSLDSEGIDLTATQIMFHYRIATHGKVAPATCHPFPLSSDTDELCELDLETNIAVAHNGIIPNMPDDSLLSDTMQYIKLYLAPLGKRILNRTVQDLVTLASSSKIALLTPDGVHLLGEFILDKKSGWTFSNNSYIPYGQITWKKTTPKKKKKFSLNKKKNKSKKIVAKKTEPKKFDRSILFRDDWDNDGYFSEFYGDDDGLRITECAMCDLEYTVHKDDYDQMYLDTGMDICNVCYEDELELLNS